MVGSTIKNIVVACFMADMFLSCPCCVCADGISSFFLLSLSH